MTADSSTGKAFEKLVGIMARLRSDGGCPWDRQQTHRSLAKYLLEETCEAIDAIDAGDVDALRSELGDIMLQIVFHARLAEEEGAFDIDDVLAGISAKLLRRHPHVFGNASVASADEVLHRWEEIKAAEPGNERRTSILDGVPSSLPALSRAMDVSKRAAGAGFEWPDIRAVLDKLREEVGELEAEIRDGDQERMAEEIGDLLFTVVNVARWLKVDPEDALRRMVARFSARFRHIEEAARDQGRSLQSMTIDEMDAVWESAKAKG